VRISEGAWKRRGEEGHGGWAEVDTSLSTHPSSTRRSGMEYTELMVLRYTYGKVTWVDLENPTSDEVHELALEFKLHPLVTDELLVPTLRPKVDIYKEFIYLILHFPVLKNVKVDQEIDFVIGKNFIITTRYDAVDPLNEFSKIFEDGSTTDHAAMGEHAGFVFFYMIRKLYRSLTGDLAAMELRLREVEKWIFAGEEKEMVKEISSLSSLLLDFRQSTKSHKEILASFEAAGKSFFGETFSYYLQDISGEYYKMYNALESNREFLAELRETNNSLLSTKQNEVMKTLTIMAFISIPLTVMASLFGMNTIHTPVVGSPYDFWIILGGMVIMCAGVLAFFKHKHWL
jgi:magnesium transporter